LDKSRFICAGPAQDLFCDLELYSDSCYIEVRLVLFKRIVIKKWIMPKEGIAVAWNGHIHGAPSDYRDNSYIGFLLLNGDLIKIPMMQIGYDKFTDPKYQPGIKRLYRGIIEQVISIPAIGIRGTKSYGIEVHPSQKKFEIANAKDYGKRLKSLYKEIEQEGTLPEDVYSRMKENNIQGKILDWLQSDGFLYNRNNTWDKVYKRD